MITPGDRYLCIVPRRDVGPDLGYLSFEGDLTLSVRSFSEPTEPRNRSVQEISFRTDAVFT
jgi:hypothetical protein